MLAEVYALLHSGQGTKLRVVLLPTLRRTALIVVALASAGGVAGAACAFPDVTFDPTNGEGETRPSVDAAIGDGDAAGRAETPSSVADAAAPAVDAGDPPDATPVNAIEACPSRCADAGLGTCSANGTCEVACTPVGACDDAIVCPAGIPCAITCTGADSCTSMIDCNAASACTVDCVGAGSCKQRVACKGSKCKVSCTGAGSCVGPIVCHAKTCDLRCRLPDTCAQPVSCSGDLCTVDCTGERACATGVCCDAGACFGAAPACP